MSMLDEIRRFPESFRFTMSKVEREVRAALPSTKQYLFDAKASDYMARFIMDCGDLILKNEQFAIPQFKNVYYEFDIDTFLRVLGRPQSGWNDETKDGTVGYLVADNVIYCMSKGLGPNAKPTLLHYGYTIGRSPLFKPIIQPLISRRQKATFFLGSTMEQATVSQFQEIAEKYEILNLTDHFDDDQLIKTIFGNATGDIRNLITMILFLYQTKDVITVEEFAPSRRILKGKQITYLSYGNVKINLRDTVSIQKKFKISGTHATPRRHWVEPYYRTTPRNKGCDHNFLCEEEGKRWRCTKCHAVRVKINTYQRGDATKGYKLKHYEVTA